MKFLIVGLGNPGEKYNFTRHNIGFSIIDRFISEFDGNLKTEKLGEVAHLKYKSKPVVLLKPNTFMNLSGKAVNYWMQKEKINLENLLIVTDDLALPFGKIRLKGKGSDGGHNGLKDIQAVLQTLNYARLRIGVGNDFQKGQQVNHVLGKWTKEEEIQLDEIISKATEFLKSFVTIGIAQTMSNLNNK